MEREITIENQKYVFSAKMAGMADLNYAPVISSWTQEAKTMLPKTPEEIAELFLQERSAIAVNALGEVVSHAAASFVYPDGSIEFGALVTGGEFKGKGSKFPDYKIFALANPVSAKLFEKIGGVVINYSDVTPEVWNYCKDCPKNPTPPKESETYIFTSCCDIPYDLTDVALSMSFGVKD
jgi:hypothetical protein